MTDQLIAIGANINFPLEAASHAQVQETWIKKSFLSSADSHCRRLIISFYLQLCGIVCVQSLWSVWREEKSIFRSLHELSIVSISMRNGHKTQKLWLLPSSSRWLMFCSYDNMTCVVSSSLSPSLSSLLQLQNTGDISGGGDSVLGLAGQHKMRQNSFRYTTGHNGSYHLGYNNPAYSTSINHLSGTALSITKYNNNKNIKRLIDFN